MQRFSASHPPPLCQFNRLSTTKPARHRVGWRHSSWLDGYAYSTLPVKGEESLVSSTASSAGPQNLDNRISTPLPEQPVDSDDRHGFLTGRCGRHAKRRGTAAIQVCSWHTTCTLHRQAARLSRAVWSCCSIKDAAHCSLYFASHVLQHPTSYL